MQEVGPPPIAHLHSHTVKPEPQEVVLLSILSGQTNYSPFLKKRHLSSSPIYLSSPPRHPACLLLVIYCFPFSSPETNSHGDRKPGYLCYLRLSCIQTLNELPLWLHRPQNSGKYSPVVFPQDLWYSCPQYPHNAFVEFPKWMKSRFIWTVLKRKHRSSLSLRGRFTLLYKSKGQEAEKEAKIFVQVYKMKNNHPKLKNSNTCSVSLQVCSRDCRHVWHNQLKEGLFKHFYIYLFITIVDQSQNTEKSWRVLSDSTVIEFEN